MMRLRFPWFTLYADPSKGSRLGCLAEMVVHEFVTVTRGHARAHARPQSIMYGVGGPPPKKAPGLRGLIDDSLTPEDGDVLTYDAETRLYGPAAGGGSVAGAVRTLKFTIAFDTPDIEPVHQVQRIAITGTPDGGTFALAYQDVETDPLAFDISDTDLSTALFGLSPSAPDQSFGDLIVTVDGDGFLIEMSDGLIYSPLTVADNSLTGGTDPQVVITQEVDASPGLIIPIDPLTTDDAILEAWIEHDVWDTGGADIGFFTERARRGFLDYANNQPIDLTTNGEGLEYAVGLNGDAESPSSSVVVAEVAGGPYRIVPASVGDDSGGILRVVVSSDGRPSGTPSGAAEGTATIFLVLSTPLELTLP